MSTLGNFAISSDCTWGENCLHVPATGYAVNTESFQPASDGSFTASVCLKLNQTPSALLPILAQASTKNVYTTNSLFYLGFNSTAIQAALKISSSTNTNAQKTLSDGAVSSGDNLVIDLVVSSTKMSIYLNGKLLTESSMSYSPQATSLKLGVCCFTNTTGLNSNVSIDCDIYAVNMYDRALTPEEIEENFNTYNTRFNLGL
jgi:hypothetical protein